MLHCYIWDVHLHKGSEYWGEKKEIRDRCFEKLRYDNNNNVNTLI